MKSALLAAALAVVGCQKSNADDWARERYGAEVATLKKDASIAFQRAEMVPGGLQPSKEGFLPRPAVVLQVAFGQNDTALEVHRVNRSLDAPPSVSVVRGFVVVRYGMKHSNKGWIRKRGRGPVEVDGVHEEIMTVTFVDRATGQGTKIEVAGSDDDALVEAIQATPSFRRPP